jgi:hypothetical protein
MKDFADLVSAIAWPVVVAAALIAFYEPLSEFVRELPRRATKIKAFQFEFDLPSLAEAHVGSFIAEIRELKPADQFMSSVMALVAQLQTAGPMDYAVIDLGDGDRWLNSRLFIFAVLLQRQRGLRRFVFVSSESSGVTKKFIGVASPESTRWSLARRFPSLERAFAAAYQQTLQVGNSNAQVILSTQGMLESGSATQLLQNFIQQIQSTTTQPGWLQLKPQLFERAEWLNRSSLESICGDLQRPWVASSPEKPHSEIVRAIARCKGDYVALLESNERFVSLVDRRAVVDQIVAKE